MHIMKCSLQLNGIYSKIEKNERKKNYNENNNKWWQQQLEKLQYTVIKPLSVLKAATIYAYTLA